VCARGESGKDLMHSGGRGIMRHSQDAIEVKDLSV